MLAAKTFFIFIICLLVSYFLGRSILHVAKKKVQQPLLLGVLIITCFSAIIFTKAITVYSLVFLVLVIGIYQLKNEKSINPVWWRDLFRITVMGVILWCYFSLYLFDLETFDPIIQFADVHYWAHLSSRISDTGIESTLIQDGLFNEQQNISLYHYFDLWFNGFVSSVSGLNSSVSLMGVVYPLLAVLALDVSYSVITDVFSSNKLGLISIFVLATIGGWTFCDIDLITSGASFFENRGLLFYHSFKLIIIYPFLIILIQHYINNNRGGILFISLILFLIYPSVALSLFCLIGILFLDWIRISNLKTILMYFSLTLFLVTVWILIFWQFISSSESILPGSLFDKFNSPIYSMRVVFDKLIQILFYFSLLIVPVVHLFRSKAYAYLLRSFIFVFCIVFPGLVYSALNDGKYDFWQFFTNISLPFLNVLSVFSLMWILSRMSNVISCITMICYSSVYLNQFFCCSELNIDLKQKNSYDIQYSEKIRNESEIGNVLFLTKSGYLNQVFIFLEVGLNCYYNDSFRGGFGVSAKDSNINLSSSFPGLVTYMKVGDINKGIRAFIKHKKIKSLVVEKGLLNTQNFPFELFVFKYSDIISGESYFKLRTY